MRLDDMRDWVRRRVHDSGAQPRYSDRELNTALNVGAQQVQAEVRRVAPSAFTRTYYRNVETGKTRYQLPRGFLQLKRVWVKYDTDYIPADPASAHQIEDQTDLANQGGVYFHVTGGEVEIFPEPTADVEDGFKMKYVPALAMADDDDDLEDMGLLAPLHIAVVLWGAKLILPEDAEDVGTIDAEIGKIMSQVPSLYAGVEAGGIEMLYPQGIGKELAG